MQLFTFWKIFGKKVDFVSNQTNKRKDKKERKQRENGKKEATGHILAFYWQWQQKGVFTL
ncbi:hypothetical protein JWG39_00110 [Desulforhopalus vacuolatus]|uniref:hypothetical protein n=1 Tax=Desulforhopalus vacuolatus TaxID=40414 RepID=UPI001963E4BC|nr:hypothetical protein [Desulforhopalus vacuolatus]MBM9518216.1 hypothetical protein [Desulforhopalus vacuolatus]